MISQETQRFIISALVGLLVLFGLFSFTNLSTLVRLPAAIVVGLIVQRILNWVGR